MDRLSEIDKRLKDISILIETSDLEETKRLSKEVDSLISEKNSLIKSREIETRKATLERVANMSGTPVMDIINNSNSKRGSNTMENTENRELADYLLNGAPTKEMRDSMGLSGVGAVLPSTIYNKMFTSGDKDNASILKKATITNFENSGTIKIPVITSTSATWHTETSCMDPEERTITPISLSGHELMKLVSFSSSALAQADSRFEDYIGNTLYEEMGSTLEYAMINGTGEGQATGILPGIDWTEYNCVETLTSSTDISVDDIMSGISLLPSKFRRKATIIGNCDTIYGKIRKLKDDNKNYILNVEDADANILGIPVMTADDMPDDTLIIGDMSKYFINFSRPITLERSRDSGFRSAVVDIRALAVVDGKPLPDAFVKVCKKTYSSL